MNGEANKDQIRKAREKVVLAYLEMIRLYYHTISEDKQIQLKNTLETLVSRLEVGSIMLTFNPKKAAELRKAAGLSQNELGITLTNNTKIPHSQSTISKYETGREIPNPKNEASGRYLKWLKDKGYNPYDI